MTNDLLMTYLVSFATCKAVFADGCAVDNVPPKDLRGGVMISLQAGRDKQLMTSCWCGVACKFVKDELCCAIVL